MDRSEARAILVNAQAYSAEQVAEATRIYFPNTTSMRPPRPPHDNSPTPDQVLRYPKMYGAARVEQAKADLEKENK